MKNEVIHARISEDIKKESETILNNIGMTLSQSIDLFLRQVVLKRGIPFELNDISNKEWEEIKTMADESKENTYAGIGVNYIFKNGVINSSRLTFFANVSGSFGGVSWLSDEGYNFDAETGELLKLEDIGTGVYDYVYNTCISNLEGETSLFDNLKDSVKEELNKEGNWYFTDNGIRIIFQKYSISDGSFGIKTIDIKKDEINKYLLNKYKIK